MYSKKHQNHLVCCTCSSPFPEAWISKRRAFRDGAGVYCSETCFHDREEEDQIPLPFASPTQKRVNGHKVLRRVQ